MTDDTAKAELDIGLTKTETKKHRPKRVLERIVECYDYPKNREPAFVEALRSLGPSAVHVSPVFVEHGTCLHFSFLGSDRRVHSYSTNIDPWADTVFKVDDLKNVNTLRDFRREYGVPLVGGTVSYHGKERYHFFVCNRFSLSIGEYGFSDQETYEGWKRAVRVFDNPTLPTMIHTVKTKRRMEGFPPITRAIIDATHGIDHYVLEFYESKNRTVPRIIKQALQIPTGYGDGLHQVIDYTPVMPWLRSVGALEE